MCKIKAYTDSKIFLEIKKPFKKKGFNKLISKSYLDNILSIEYLTVPLLFNNL
mgnify:CR=1 FL=1